MRRVTAILTMSLGTLFFENIAPADVSSMHRSATQHAATQPTTEISPGVYSSDKFGFTVTTPTDWHRQQSMETAPVVLVVSAVGTPDGQAVTILRIEYRPKIRGKFDTIVTSVEKTAAEGDPKAESSPVASAMLGGNPAKRFTVLKTIKGISTRISYLVTIKNGQLYTFSIQNDGKHDPVKDTIETSFKFTK